MMFELLIGKQKIKVLFVLFLKEIYNKCYLYFHPISDLFGLCQYYFCWANWYQKALLFVYNDIAIKRKTFVTVGKLFKGNMHWFQYSHI